MVPSLRMNRKKKSKPGSGIVDSCSLYRTEGFGQRVFVFRLGSMSEFVVPFFLRKNKEKEDSRTTFPRTSVWMVITDPVLIVCRVPLR